MHMIGEGGMGRVYAAEHVGIGKKVALKILHAVFSNTSEAVERFRSEARTTSRIANAHIVDVTDSGTTIDGRLYFVMEHLDGVELGEAMHDGKLSLERALKITKQIASALAAAHAQGVIHRDLKPENILLIERDGSRDFVKVLDFGIALTVGGEQPKRRLTQPGLAVGTPEYMAPEQAMDNKADARSDVYALGAMLYEMATGKPAYQGDTFTKILVDKVNADPPRPREVRPELPPEVEEVIVKAMARKADERHQSMNELIDDLVGCLSVLSMPLSAPHIVLPPPVAPAPPRHTPPPITAAGLLLDAVDPNAATLAMTVEPPKTKKRDVVPLVLVSLFVIGGAVALYLYVLRPSSNATQTAAPAANPPPTHATAAKPTTLTDPKTSTKPGGKPDTKPTRTAATTPATGTLPGHVDAPAKPPAAPPKTAKQARALLAKGKAAAAKKQWDAAREHYDRVARGRHDPERGHLGLAQVALATGDAKAAQKHARTSVRLGGGSPARKVLSQATAKLKKTKGR
jgi:serine/threonine protein kinase